MKNKTFKGEITAQTTQNAQSKVYFDCATMMEERGVVYDEMTPENLRDWFKATKFKFPVQVMEDKDFWGFIYKDKETGEYSLMTYRMKWGDDEVKNKWTLRIGKTITKSRWFGITRFIEDYITGDLQERYDWSENKTLRLA